LLRLKNGPEIVYSELVIMNEMCFGESQSPGTAQSVHRNHLVGIFSRYSYEMTRKTAKLCECSWQYQ